MKERFLTPRGHLDGCVGVKLCAVASREVTGSILGDPGCTTGELLCKRGQVGVCCLYDIFDAVCFVNRRTQQARRRNKHRTLFLQPCVEGLHGDLNHMGLVTEFISHPRILWHLITTVLLVMNPVRKGEARTEAECSVEGFDSGDPL